MIGAVRRTIDRLRGSGDSSVTVPSMDGALRPNNLLETAEVVARLDGPDDIANGGSRIVLSGGQMLYTLLADRQIVEPTTDYGSAITCLAGHESGALAVGLAEGKIVVVGGAHDGKVLTNLGSRPMRCLTAMAFADASTLLVCLGSQKHEAIGWKRDLMERCSSGSVWRVDLRSSETQCLGDGLSYPSGIAALRSGGVVVSESWKHRLLLLDGRKPKVILSDLPGYPSRLASGENDEFWLCLFAPRRQMVEFVLRERAYCNRMMAEVPEPFWMAPSLSSGHSFEEPLQGGAVKHLGIHKPWAPTLSYGLLVQLNSAFTPIASAHSRADGKHHGLTGVLADGGRIYGVARGGNAILRLDPAALSEE